jgi:hypothetical protein
VMAAVAMAAVVVTTAAVTMAAVATEAVAVTVCQRSCLTMGNAAISNQLESGLIMVSLSASYLCL